MGRQTRGGVALVAYRVMTPIQVGLVGCGRMGRVHLAVAAALPGIEIAAVCDPVLEETKPPTFGYPIRSFDEVITSSSIDAIVIAAPTAAHHGLARAALNQGKHVLCEKPLTLSPVSDHDLEATAAARRCLLQVGFWRRFAEPYGRIRQLLSEGRIGAVTGVRTAQWDAHPPRPEFCNPDVSGGLEIDCGVHEFDLVRWLLATEIQAVAACSPSPSRALGAVGDVDTVFGLAKLSGERTMAIDLTRTAGYRDSIRTEVVGERGTIVTEFDERGTVIIRSDDQRDEVDLVTRNVVHDSVAEQLRAFGDSVRNGRLHPDAGTAQDSVRALVAARALRAARTEPGWHVPRE